MTRNIGVAGADSREKDLLTSVIYPPGTVLGSYKVLDTIGRGGMGTVYLAEHARLGRHVALKVLHSEFAERKSAVRRFFAEARAANQIHHENIVEVTDFVEDLESGCYYLVMELLRGKDLLSLIHEHGVLPLSRSLGVAIQLAGVLAAAHEAGIVHRDVKPGNVFLTERAGQKDFVKVLDFGVAKLGDEPSGPIDVSGFNTAPGAIIGTPVYMSPEQGAGAKVDYRTDIYSFGVVLYEMVTGEPPFNGETFGELLMKHMASAPHRPSTVPQVPHPIPPELDELILACLSKDPASRPTSMAEVQAELARIAADRSWQVETFIRPKPGPPPRSALRVVVPVAIAVAVLAVAVVVAALAVSPGREPSAVADQNAGVARPAKVSISFASEPAGAEVWPRGATERIGTTPLTSTFDRREGSAAFELRKEGYRTVLASVSLDDDARLVFTLAPIAPADTSNAGDAGPRPGAGPGDQGSPPAPATEAPGPGPGGPRKAPTRPSSRQTRRERDPGVGPSDRLREQTRRDPSKIFLKR